MRVSVIIPTYNRCNQLLRCLDALAQQRYQLDCCEIIVVDDGSTDLTPTVVRTPIPFRVQYRRQPNRGSAAARNVGAKTSEGEILIFLDDDILVEPEFVAAIVREHESVDRTIVVGSFRHCVSAQATTFQAISMAESCYGTKGSDPVHPSFTQVTSNNVSIRRADFFALGMWQDVAGDGQTLWGDVDFAYRAYRKGFAFRRSPGAICYHDDYAARDLAIASRRAEMAAQRAVFLFDRYPELVSFLPMFRDKTPIAWGHEPIRLSMRKIARVIASSHALLQSLEQFVRLLERHFPMPMLLRPLYRWIIGGYVFRGYRQGVEEFGRA